MKKKYAIVTEGGGMRCAYSAGVLYALLKNFPSFKPNILVGSSGSTGSLAYYVSKQSNEIRKIWTEEVSSNKFLNPLRLNMIMSIDYLIDVIFKIQEPLLIKHIMLSKQKLFISATNVKNGNPHYFSNNDDIYESLRASKAIPVLYGKKVTIGEIDYIDGNFSSPLSKNVQKAIKEGATDILIIRDENSKKNSKIIYYSLKLWSFFQKAPLRNMISNYLQEKEIQKDFFKKCCDNGINFHIISPSGNILSPLDNSKVSVKGAFEMGKKDCTNDKKLKKFLSL